MIRLFITFVSSLFIFWAPLQAQQSKIDSLEAALQRTPENIDLRYELALHCHAIVQKEKDNDVWERAEKLFQEILAVKPEHVAALVYYGSLLTIKGRDALLPWNKLRYVEQGCDKMDKAVQIAPDNINIRIVRALNNIHLPDFFNRLPYCLEDFENIRKRPEFNHLDPASRQQILYYSGQAFEKDDQAVKAIESYKKAISINGHNPLAVQARQALKELTE